MRTYDWRHLAPSTFDLDERVLLNNIRHGFLLLLALIDLLLKLRDLLEDLIKSMTIWRSICHGTNECRVGVLERLENVCMSQMRDYDRTITHSILFLSSELTGRLEVDTKERELAFIRFTGIFDGVDVESRRKSMDR